MLIDKIFAEAEPVLKKRKISNVYIGLTMAAVQLDDGGIGTSLILREEVNAQDPISFDPEIIKKMEAIEMAKWATVPDAHVLKRTLGIATINACAYSQNLAAADRSEAADAVQFEQEDTVGFIGWIRGLVKKTESRVQKVIIYDNAVNECVYPPETQEEWLPQCDVVFISGTAFVNQTMDQLIELCKNAREVIITGPTTPMFPSAYRDTNVTVLAGGLWKKERQEQIFSRIALNAGVSSLSPYFEKISLKLKN